MLTSRILKFVFFLCILFAPAIVHAFSLSVKQDTSVIDVRVAPSEKIQSFAGDRDFNYEEKPVVGETLSQKIWYWVSKWFNALFSDEGVAPYIRYSIIIAFIALVVYLIVKARIQKAYYRNRSVSKIVAEELIENLHEINMDELIDASVRNSDYRKAIRYLYLKLLKSLSDKNMIRWAINKTNFDYLAEVESFPFKNKFRSLSAMYEFTWYGDFAVGGELYEQVKGEFSSFYDQVNA